MGALDGRVATPDDELVMRARRLGPLPGSALGLGPPVPMPPEVTAWAVAQIDRVWDELGRPDPLAVVDVSGQHGRLTRALLDAGPRSSPALRYLVVTDDRPVEGLDLEEPALVLGPALPAKDEDDPPRPPPGIGPLVAAVADLPGGLDVALVLAVGWISRLPADRFVPGDGAWLEVRWAAGDTGELVALTVAARDRGPADDPVGAGEVQDRQAAGRWVGDAVATAAAGRLIVLDRLDPAAVAQLTRQRRPRVAPSRPFAELVQVEWSVGNG